jgi:hypothetical protein
MSRTVNARYDRALAALPAARRPWSPLTPTAALDTVRGDDTIDVR